MKHRVYSAFDTKADISAGDRKLSTQLAVCWSATHRPTPKSNFFGSVASLTEIFGG